MKLKDKRNSADRRHSRVRAKISGTADRPRLSVSRSNRSIFVQVIDDASAVSLVGVDLKSLSVTNTVDGAKALGLEVAKRAKEKKVTKVVFDRGGYRYAGKIQAVAEGAREGGLEF